MRGVHKVCHPGALAWRDDYMPMRGSDIRMRPGALTMRGGDIAIRLDVLTMRGDREVCHRGVIVLPSDREPMLKLSRFCQRRSIVP